MDNVIQIAAGRLPAGDAELLQVIEQSVLEAADAVGPEGVVSFFAGYLSDTEKQQAAA